MGTKDDRAELREQAKRLRATYEHLSSLHEELRVITETVRAQVLQAGRELQLVRKLTSGASKRG